MDRYLFNHIMVNIKSKSMQQFPQLLCISNSSDKRWLKSSSASFNARRQRDRTDIKWEKRAQCSRIRTLKVRYFPRVAQDPLREVSYWPRNSIKRSNIEESYIERSENVTAATSLDPPLFSKRVSTDLCEVEEQITFS